MALWNGSTPCDDAACLSALCVSRATGVNWTSLCAVAHSGTWACCGHTRYNHVFPIALWLSFGCVTVWCHLRTGLFGDLVLGVHTLHDIRTQALGVVVARQKRVIFGKVRRDPRRVLLLISMAYEVVGFSYIPGQLLLYQFFNSGAFVGQFSGELQWAKCILGTTLFVVLEVWPPRCWPRSWTSARDKLLAPLLYDLCYTTVLYGVVDVGGCWNGADDILLPDGTNCADASRFWLFPTFGTLLFIAFYYGTLEYKRRLSDDIFSVQFRYHASFNGVMIVVRTAGVLGFYAVEKGLLELDALVVSVSVSIVHVFFFATLLYYNYTHQPVTHAILNLSFASACYSGALLLVVSAMQLSAGRHAWTAYETILASVATILYAPLALLVWRWNRAAALRYQVPNAPLLELLRHGNLRVRAVAAVSMVLEDVVLDPVEIRAQILALHATLQAAPHAEDGCVAAYSCQALWHLWRHRFERNKPFLETPKRPTACWKFGCWAHSRESGPNLALLEPTPHALASAATSRMSTRRSSNVRVARFSIVGSRGISLGRLAEQQTCRNGIMSIFAPVAFDAGMHRCATHAIDTLTSLVRSRYAKARFIAAKVLLEMYKCRVLQLTRDSVAFVAITRLVSSPRLADADAAAETLRRLMNEGDGAERKRLLLVAFTDHLNVLHVTQAMATTEWDIEISVMLLQLLTDALTLCMVHDTPSSDIVVPPPDRFLSKAAVEYLVQLQSCWKEHRVFGMVDNVLVLMRQCCEHHAMKRQSASSAVLPEPCENTLMGTREYNAVLERHRTRVSVLTSVQWVLAEGYPSQMRLNELSPNTRLALEGVASLIALGDNDLVAYLESNLSEPQRWYLGGLLGSVVYQTHDDKPPS
ncbi:hypothetical protein SPRG_13654 [Saprolegnia parasitica CBS 223.65]|uniref:Uncharacterized protein n=1 Tax=Saprolegnia parasitica (strain CBS 223.65) TaxID=695850 RepID=A0A067C3F9_SAPPC|nr:hypothetical protein SPRG_13654 [Saprolegnia parasitica CBS 223.65]KDO21337.1 hypothetical protein SPRG_13654 [Saprolegnia parasitica CBS 223.65]|eukprot:XP_012207897.1 hypothetical protein SPRG_13654 [Saprolegnia parasitica CBS 223.65]